MKVKRIIILIILLLTVFIKAFPVNAEEKKVYLAEDIASLATILSNNNISEDIIINQISTINFNNTINTNIIINTFDYSIDISKNKDNSVILGLKNNTLYIQFAGILYLNEDSTLFLSGFESVQSIEGLEYLNTSQVTNMFGFFSRLKKLESIDVSSFNTSNVTNMSYMFYNCLKLKKIDLRFITTNNPSTTNMLYGDDNLGEIYTPNYSLNIDLPKKMYDDNNNEYNNLNTIQTSIRLRRKNKICIDNDNNCRDVFFNEEVSLPIPTKEDYEFTGYYITDDTYSTLIERIENIFLYDYTINLKLKTNFVTTSTFIDGHSFNRILESIDVKTIQEFKRANSINPTISVENMNVVSTKDSKFPIFIWREEDILYYYTEEQTPRLNPDSSYMFYNLGFDSPDSIVLNLENFDTTKVTNMSYLFAGTGYTSELYININNWNTRNVTNMSNMFENTCRYTKECRIEGLSNLDTRNVTNMSYMFRSFGTKLTTISLDLSNWNTSQVKDMQYMFNGAGRKSKLMTIGNLSNWNTSNVTNLSYMFSDSGIEELNLKNWDTSHVTSMKSMLENCISLTKLDITNFTYSEEIQSNSNLALSLSGCESLSLIVIPDSLLGIPLIRQYSATNNSNEIINSANGLPKGTVLRRVFGLKFISSSIQIRNILYGDKINEFPVLTDTNNYYYTNKWYTNRTKVDNNYIYTNEVTKDTIIDDEYFDLHENYISLYAEYLTKYTVTFVNDDESILKEATSYLAGTEASDIILPPEPTKEKDEEYTYTFIGWQPEIENVTRNITYQAKYKKIKNKYTITWNNYDGTELQKDIVEYGIIPEYKGKTPIKEKDKQYTYTFDKWDKQLTPVTGDITYTATYTNTINKYDVIWKDDEGNILEEDKDVEYGSKLSYNGELFKNTDYKIIGWYNNLEYEEEIIIDNAIVESDIILYAKYTFIERLSLESDVEQIDFGTITMNFNTPITKTLKLKNNSNTKLTIRINNPFTNNFFDTEDFVEKELEVNEVYEIKVCVSPLRDIINTPGLYHGDYEIVGISSSSKTTSIIIPAKLLIKDISVKYKTHVQSFGWQDYVTNGTMSGTSGEAKRLEGIKIKLEDSPYNGNIFYRTHIQSLGWEEEFKTNDEISGTEGQGLRLEAIEIKLDGEISYYYDVYYRVHAQSFGWLGWARNGESSGTAGYAKRLEGIEIKLVPKGPSVEGYGEVEAFKEKKVLYKTHVQSYGWQDYVADGEMSGTSGEAKRLEAIQIKLNNPKYEGDIEYRTHVQSYGWQDYVKNDELSGTSGEAKRLEAIEIKLTGEMAEHYDIYYRVHAQSFGWLAWAKNGEMSGTEGLAKRLEGIEIVLVNKGETPPVRENQNNEKSFVEKEV